MTTYFYTFLNKKCSINQENLWKKTKKKQNAIDNIEAELILRIFLFFCPIWAWISFWTVSEALAPWSQQHKVAKTTSKLFSLSNDSHMSPFFALYGHLRHFKFKQKYQQYGPCFQTVFPFFMTMVEYKVACS